PMFNFFFFQAEDGIRDDLVTGVQTCALPIYLMLEQERFISYTRDVDSALDRVAAGEAQAAFLVRPPAVSDVVAVARAGQVMPQKIGRASCRERGGVEVGGGECEGWREDMGGG